VVEFLKILDFYRGVLHATKSYFYKCKEIEFALVEVSGWSYYLRQRCRGSKFSWFENLSHEESCKSKNLICGGQTSAVLI